MKMANKKAAFTVTVDLPEDVTRAEMASYIHDAVCGWKGGFHPSDALFNLNREKVKVKDAYENAVYTADGSED